MAQLDNVFRFVYSSSIHERIQIKIGTLEGIVPKPSYEKLLSDPLIRFSGICAEPVPSLMVILQVFNNGKPLGLPVNTTYKAFGKRFNWNEWVTLPIQFSDLPRTAVLALTVVDCAGGGGRTTIVGGTAIPFFGKNGKYRQGMFDLRVWPSQVADGRLATLTPGKTKASTSAQQMQRLAKLSKKHHNGQMPKVDWLDRLTFREIEMINEKEKTESDHMYLLVEFQSVQSAGETYSVVYFEPDGELKYQFITKPKLVTVPDSEILQDNLVEKKHHRLSRSARSDVFDRELKPNASDREKLDILMDVKPPNYMPTSEEQDLIWKFRFHLSDKKKSLVIFLRCINWETPSEVQQALNLVQTWDPLDGSDALALLTPDFPQPEVRRYAVERLQQSSDEVLLMYLLQLVQALKYENLTEFEAYADRMEPAQNVIQSIDEPLDTSSSQDGDIDALTPGGGPHLETESLHSSRSNDTSVGRMSEMDAALDLAASQPSKSPKQQQHGDNNQHMPVLDPPLDIDLQLDFYEDPCWPQRMVTSSNLSTGGTSRTPATELCSPPKRSTSSNASTCESTGAMTDPPEATPSILSAGGSTGAMTDSPDPWLPSPAKQQTPSTVSTGESTGHMTDTPPSPKRSSQHQQLAASASAPPPPPPPPPPQAPAPPQSEHSQQSQSQQQQQSMQLPPLPATPPKPSPPVALYTLLIDRAGRNIQLANYLYWYLSTECESNDDAVRKSDVRVHRMYEKMLMLLKRSLETGDAAQRHIKLILDRQQLFVDELVRLVRMVQKESGTRMQKQERFKQLLNDPDCFRIRFTEFEPLPLPLDPTVLITGVQPAKTVLFNSAMMPAQLTFNTTSGRPYVVIFKLGDDLRQDQLVMQIIQLMNRMMFQEHTDLKLTPYRVLATGIQHGFLQYIPSMTVADVCSTHGSISKFFAKPPAANEKPINVDYFTRSLAGYCVITYLLGVGDRHLDNVLLTHEGALFHIDFGYILGRDPKPMPPAMKLTKDMVEAMGGTSSAHFRDFAKLIFDVYLALRRQAKLMMNLFALMLDANIPDIALEPDKAVGKVEHHLRLDLTEEEAIMHLQRVIDSSVSAVMPGMLDQMHKMAQFLRR